MPLLRVFLSNGQNLTTVFQKLTTALFLCTTLYASESITLGLTGVTLKEDITTIMNLKNYLNKKSSVAVDIKFAKSYSIMESFIQNGTVDVAYVCGSTFNALQKNEKAELLVLPVTSNQTTSYSSLIITKADAPFNSLLELQGETFAMSDPDSNSGSLVPFFEIVKNGFNKERFFQKVIFTYDHGESIEAVLSGFVAGASVDSMVYEAYAKKKPEIKHQLKIIDDFKGYPVPPFVVQTELDSKVKNELREIFLAMDKDKEGGKILEAMAITKFTQPTEISYEKIQKIKEFLIKRRNR